MRILRSLLTCLVILLVLGGLFVGAVFSPFVQTWWVQRELNRLPGVTASVDSVWAGLHRIEITNLRLERDGAVLIVPELEARLPLKTALWDKRLVVTSLVAKGWTFDRSHAVVAPKVAAGRDGPTANGADRSVRPGEDQTSPPAASPSRGPAPFRGLLAGLRLPRNSTIDGVQLDGSVAFTLPSVAEPAHVHVVLIGGGLAAGRTGSFTVDANGSAANQTLRWQTSAAHGNLLVSTSSAGAITKLEFQGAVSSEDQSLPKGLSLSADIAAADSAGAETYRVALTREARSVAAVVGRYQAEAARFEGTWTVAADAMEVPAFFPGRRLPRMTAQGDGRFDANPALTDVHLSGHLAGTADRWTDLGAALGNVGALTFETAFEVSRESESVRLDRLELAVRAGRAVGEFRVRQPLTLDSVSGRFAVRDPKTEWLAGSVRSLPLAWLPALGNGLTVAGGELDGEFALAASATGIHLSTAKPLTVKRADLQLRGAPVLTGVDLAIAVSGEYSSEEGLDLRVAPLTVDSAGRRLATFSGTLHPILQVGQTLAVSGNTTVDLDLFATQPGGARFSWVRGRSVTANFSATLGRAAELTAKFDVVGHDRGRTLNGTIGATLDDDQAAAFRVPLTITTHGKASDVSVDGTWAHRGSGPQIDITVTAHQADFDALRLLAGALSTADGVSLATTWEQAGQAVRSGVSGHASAMESGRDSRPFWGDVTGRLRFEFNQLDFGSHTLHAVAATVGFAPDGLQINGGRAAFSPVSTAKQSRGESTELPLEPNSVLSAEARLGFDARAALPYHLSATAGADVVDAPRIFGPVPPGREPMIQGQFAVATTLTGDGRTLSDLLARREFKVRLTSTGGAVRILRTSVAEALPDAPTPVADTAAKVGSAVGWLFGVSKDAMLVQNRLPPQTEAVLNFTYQTRELPYTRCVIDAVVHPAGMIDVTALDVEGANQRFTGTGQIAPAAGLSLSNRPLHLDLQLYVRGASADQLGTAGLLSGEKVDGFSKVRVPLRFGGTLDQLDRTQWRDVLVQAATTTPQPRRR